LIKNIVALEGVFNSFNKEINWRSYSSIPPLSGINSGAVTQLQPTKNKQKNSTIPKTNNFFVFTFTVL